MEQKKVLMVLMGLEIGGAETHVVGLSAALQTMGWQVVVASAGGVYEQKLKELGIRHYHVSTATRNLKHMAGALRALEKIIREEKPDVVHAHARIPAMLCGILQKKLNFPFVTTAHWTFAVNPILRRLTNWGQQTVAVSEDIRTYLMENYQVPSDQIHVTVNGIDMTYFSRETSPEAVQKEFAIRKDAPVVVCVTRFHESRVLSARLLVEAAADLAEQLPGLQILLVGDGDCMAELKTLAEETNRRLGETCLILTGGRTDVAELINAGDVFVGVSRAALEAMSCEKPVILCGNEGYGGIFRMENLEENSRTNFCCRDMESSTAGRLTRDLLALFQLPREARGRLGREGREVIRRHYSLHAMAEDCLRAYALAMHPKKKLVLSGYYGYHNQGDDAILRTLSERYGSRYALTVLSRNPAETRSTYGVSAVRRFSPAAVRRALKNSDALLSGGGSLLQDRTSTRSLLYYLWVIHRAVRLGRPVMVYANGVGPITGKLNRKLTARVLRRVQLLTVRDEDSASVLRQLGVTGSIEVTADPVFRLKAAPREQGRALLDSAGIPQGKPLFGISLRQLQGKAAENMAAYLDLVCTQTGLVPVFLCMQQPQDLEASLQIARLMKTQSWILREHSTAEELMAALGCMELVAGMRLHAVVMSAAAGTLTLGFDYDPKLVSMLNMLGLPVLKGGEALNPEACCAETCALLDRREPVLEHMQRSAAEQCSRAERNDLLLEQMLEAGSGSSDK